MHRTDWLETGPKYANEGRCSTALVSRRLSLTGNKRRAVFLFVSRIMVPPRDSNVDWLALLAPTVLLPLVLRKARARLAASNRLQTVRACQGVSFGLARRPAGLADREKGRQHGSGLWVVVTLLFLLFFIII